MVTEKPIGEMRGQFKVLEESPLKQHKPYKISSKIFRQVEFPQLTGWAGIAVSGEDGRATQEEGVAVLVEMDKGVMQVFFVAGVASLPDNILAVCNFVNSYIEKGGSATPPPSGFNENGH